MFRLSPVQDMTFLSEMGKTYMFAMVVFNSIQPAYLHEIRIFPPSRGNDWQKRQKP
jgi:hypothetical protein